MGAPIISLRDGHKWWPNGGDPIHVLRGVSLDVQAGESVAITGPSGCGKSTLLHTLGLLTPLDSGEIVFQGRCVHSESARRDVEMRRSVAFVFQDAKLVPDLNLLENVCLPLLHRGVWPWHQRRLACRCIDQVGLLARVRHYPHKLSGGERIRAAIARALAMDAKLLLCDEPTGSLDSVQGEQIADLLFQLTAAAGALVIATHNPDLAGRAARRIRMKDGCFLPAVAGCP